MIRFANKDVVDYFSNTILETDKIKYYYDLFFHNLRYVPYAGFTTKFLRVDEVFSDGIININNTDKFVIDGYEKLGKDIEKRGMYYPFFLDDIGGRYRVSEGINRYHALSLIKNKDKFLMFVKPNDLSNPRYLEKEMELYLLYPTKYINYMFKEKTCLKFIDKLEDDLYLIKTNNVYELYTLVIFMGSYIGRLTYPFQSQINPNPITTNVEEYKNWINSYKK
jgi:hypothetical protein